MPLPRYHEGAGEKASSEISGGKNADTLDLTLANSIVTSQKSGIEGLKGLLVIL